MVSFGPINDPVKLISLFKSLPKTVGTSNVFDTENCPLVFVLHSKVSLIENPPPGGFLLARRLSRAVVRKSSENREFHHWPGRHLTRWGRHVTFGMA
jgi:hypothetical protein